MNRSFSLYLDALRTLAALAVLASHWAYPRFTAGDHIWMRRHDLGGDAVVIFFVLSGLLIAYAARRRPGADLGGFALARASRLWSVAIPAIAVTLIADAAGRALDPSLYDGFYAGDGMAFRALAAVSFTNELWFANIRPGSNGPWWSLGYEAWYYAIFAALVFLKGTRRWVWAGALALIAGPRIWLLAPAWIMGWALWRSLETGAHRRISPAAALTLFAGAPLAYALAQTVMLPARLQAATADLLGPYYGLLGFSDTFVWAAMLGVLMIANLLGAATLFERLRADAPQGLDRAVRWCAGASFTLYLTHYPLLQLAGAALPGAAEDALRQTALLAIPLAGALLIAEVSERRRAVFHAWLAKLANAAGSLLGRRAHGGAALSGN